MLGCRRQRLTGQFRLVMIFLPFLLYNMRYFAKSTEAMYGKISAFLIQIQAITDHKMIWNFKTAVIDINIDLMPGFFVQQRQVFKLRGCRSDNNFFTVLIVYPESNNIIDQNYIPIVNRRFMIGIDCVRIGRIGVPL